MITKKNVVKVFLLSALLIPLAFCAGYRPATFIIPGANPSFDCDFDYQPEGGRKLAKPLTLLMLKAEDNMDFPTRFKLDKKFTGVTEEVKDNLDHIAKSYAHAIGDDFKEMVTMRGFRIQGALQEQSEVTWLQREQSDFCLKPNVDIVISDQVISSSSPDQSFADRLMTNKYNPGSVTGKLSVKARIKLDIFEPLSWQLLWTKSIETEQVTMDYSYRWNYAGNGGYVVGEDSRPQIIANALTENYHDTMDKLYVYLDPDELAALSKQALEIRKKSRGVIK